MADDQQCQNTEPHRFHSHEVAVETSCTGTTRCGERLHEGHDFIEVRRVWCHGICDCGMTSRGPHGPGAHK